MDSPSMSVVERFAQLENADFSAEIIKLWEGGRHVVDAIIEQVEEGTISPVQGLGIVGCTTSQLYGYNAFHGQPSSADLLGSLSPANLTRS